MDGAPVQEKQIHVLDVSGILIFSASQILLLASVSLSDPNGFVSGGLHSNLESISGGLGENMD